MAKVKVEIELSRGLEEDLLTTALEGGSNYWYFIPQEATDIIDKLVPNNGAPFVERIYKALLQDAILPIEDCETYERIGNLSLKSIEEGEQIMANEYPNHFKNLINGDNVDWDAETADVWFQLAVMGKIVYG